MRNQRTREEQIVINLVSNVLLEEGNEVVEDIRFHDKPDWVFSLNGKRVAAECSLIGLEELMKWSNCKRKMIPEKIYKVTFPVEPHLWMKTVIERKERKVPDYIKNSDSEEAWLITHSDFKVGLSLYECTSWMLELMKSAAAATATKFSSVWFVHPETGASKLWDIGEPKVDFPSLDLSSGSYPTETYMTLIGTLTNADWIVSVGIENTIEHITLPILDKRYKWTEEELNG